MIVEGVFPAMTICISYGKLFQIVCAHSGEHEIS